MNAQKSNRITGKRKRIWLTLSFFLFALFIINVLFGKINILYGLNLPHLSDVAEFLLEFGTCILIIIAALKQEAKEKNAFNSNKQERKVKK